MKRLVAIAGKQGAGKDAIIDAVVSQASHLFKKKVSYTTRERRPFETDGIHYYFLSDKEFFNKLVDESIIEATDVNGNMYGTGVENLADDFINIGVFDPAGLDILYENKDIDTIIFYIDVPENVRIIRVLNQKRGQTFQQIYERHLFDEDAFKDIEDRYKMTGLRNDDETDIGTLADVIILIARQYFKIWHFKKNIV